MCFFNKTRVSSQASCVPVYVIHATDNAVAVFSIKKITLYLRDTFLRARKDFDDYRPAFNL